MESVFLKKFKHLKFAAMNRIDRKCGNEFIITRVDNGFRLIYLFFWVYLIVGGVFLFYLPFIYDFLVFIILYTILSTYWHRLRMPANFWFVRIRKEENLLYVNRKVFLLDDLIFLSFYESEAYTTIRLEARRKNILFPNEARLMSDCSGFEEAIQICREIRDFIDPSLKICYVRMVAGKSVDTGRGSRGIKFEHREFIE